MRLHSDILTRTDIREATRAFGMTGVRVEITDHGSRARERAFEVHLTGTSPRRPNSGSATGPNQDDYAATWDEWGMFFAALFEVDPNMIAGSPGQPAYANANAFHAATEWRFTGLTASQQHRSHKWVPLGDHVFECACGAVQDQSYTYRKVTK